MDKLKLDTGRNVSVVVPVYNVEPYLEECLDSLVAQSLKEIEILVVNDGSTDRSEEIARRYCREHQNIVLVNKKNRGCASARNVGIECSRGDYVGFVDSDDWVGPSMFEKLYSKATKTNADIVQCGLEKYHEKGNIFEAVEEDWIEARCGRAPQVCASFRNFYCFSRQSGDEYIKRSF